MDTIPHDVYTLLVHELSCAQWMRYALISKGAHKYIFTSVKCIEVRSTINRTGPDSPVPLRCISNHPYSFGHLRTMKCVGDCTAGLMLRRNRDTFMCLVAQVEVLTCPSAALSIAAKKNGLFLPKLRTLELEIGRTSSCWLHNKIFTPNLESIENLHFSDDIGFLKQPLNRLTRIGITLEADSRSIEWVQELVMLEHRFSLEMTLVAFGDESTLLKDKVLIETMVNHLRTSRTISNLKLTTFECATQCILPFARGLSGLPFFKHLHISSAFMNDRSGINLSEFLEHHAEYLEKLGIDGDYNYIQRFITQPSPMKSLTHLYLSEVIISRCWNDQPLELDFPCLEQLTVTKRCSGEIAKDSKFPKLVSYLIDDASYIIGLIQSLENTATCVKTVDVDRPEDVVVTKSLERVDIRLRKKAMAYWGPVQETENPITHDIPRIIQKTIDLKPPLRSFNISHPLKCIQNCIDTQLTRLRMAFPEASIPDPYSNK